MHRMHRNSFIVLGLIAAISFASARAQEVQKPEPASTPAVKKAVINIWPGVAPGSEQWKQPEAILGSGDMERIVNVTAPTLTAYLPALRSRTSKKAGTLVVSWQPLAYWEKAHHQQGHLGGLPGSCYTSRAGR